jgi:HAD superfamily hydrolase (TIGR01484 family)
MRDNFPLHWFFDLDDTLTPSKSLILPEHVPVLKRLSEVADVVVVSGHGEKDIRKHLTAELNGAYHILGQNGNFAETKDGRFLWNRSLSETTKAAILGFIAKAKKHLDLSVRDESDIVEDRDSQIAYSLIGHHEDKDKKRAFDPKHEKRRKLLSDLAEDVHELHKANAEARIGGTTNIDFFELGKHKGHNVGEFIKAMNWQRDECIYVGDALFPGGNDETVIGIIPTHAVKNPEETFSFIQEMLN